MNRVLNHSELIEITPSSGVKTTVHGWRAKCLQRLVRMDLPVPTSFALSAEAVRAMAQGATPQASLLGGLFEKGDGLVSVRPSAVMPEWGGPQTVLNVGINDECHRKIVEARGQEAADAIYLSFVQSYAVNVARLDPDMFAESGEGALARSLDAYRAEMDEDFPQDPKRQLTEVLRSMARAWDSPTARLLRQAKGAPEDAPLGLVVQAMALAVGPGISGSGTIQMIDSVTGVSGINGRFRGQMHGRLRAEGAETLYLTKDPRGPSLEEIAPDAFSDLVEYCRLARSRLRDEMQIEFVVSDGQLSIIDALRVQRSSRAAVRVAVS